MAKNDTLLIHAKNCSIESLYTKQKCLWLKLHQDDLVAPYKELWYVALVLVKVHGGAAASLALDALNAKLFNYIAEDLYQW